VKSSRQQEGARNVVFVTRRPAGESLRSARAIRKLDGVRLLCVCEELPGADESEVFAELSQVDDTHDAGQLIAAAQRLGVRHGPLEQVVTAQETLLEPVARANEALGLRGMTVAAVARALDKSCLKRILNEAGVRTARDRLITVKGDARRFVDEVGFPIVLKPLNGSGGLATWRIRSHEQLDAALGLIEPSPEAPVLAEDHLRGQELCIDTITVLGEPRFYSVCCYSPSILEALENPQVQWSCIMPRDITNDRFRAFIDEGLKAVRALSVGNAMTHMEGFLLEDGGVCFTDATLRPAGARIAPMLAFAYDMDPYLAWARIAVDGSFDGPWQRLYAVGTIFLRGTGDGFVERVEGIESVRQRVGELIVEARLPRAGAAKSVTYTGDGFITLRHPETRVVEEALGLISRTVRITYSQTESRSQSEGADPGQWSQWLQHFDKQLNKPAWDDESLPGL
jgi:hypothetical protein